MKIKIKILPLICAFILSLSFLSCNKTEKTDEPQKKEQQKVTNVYKSTVLDIPKNYNIIGDIIIKDDKISFLCQEVIDETDYKVRHIIYSINLNDENNENFEVEEIKRSSEYSNINKIEYDSENNLYILESVFDSDTYENTYILKKYSPDDELLMEINPSDLFTPSDGGSMYSGGGGNSIYINNFKVLNDGSMVFTSDMNMLFVTKEGTKSFELTEEEFINRLAVTSDGQAFLTVYERGNAGGGYVIKNIDAANKTYGTKITAPPNVINIREIFSGTGYDYFLSNDTGIFGYNKNDTEATLLLDWINSDIISNNINNIYIKDKETFFYTKYDEIENRQKIIMLERIPDEEVKPKYIITLAYTSYIDYMLPYYITNFNQASDEYRIVLKDYSMYNTQETNWQGGMQELEKDIVSNNSPDFIFGAGYDYTNLIKKDVFADIYPFIDNDPDYSRSSFFPFALSSFEYKGKLAQLVINMSLQSLCGKTSNLNNMSSWNISEMLDYENNLPEGTKLFDDTYYTKSAMLLRLLRNGIDNYINYETLTCNFESESFVKLLEYCNKYPKEIDYNNIEYNNEEDRYLNYRTDKIMVNDFYLSGISEYLNIKFQFNFEPITVIGYPTESGSGFVVNPNTSFLILENSLYKDGIWQFLKEAMKPIETARGMRSVPALIESFNLVAEEEKKYSYFFYYNGGWSTSYSEDQIQFQEETRTDGMPAKLTQTEIDELFNILNSIKTSPKPDEKIIEIITEETDPYFAGDKTVNDVTKIIQSKINIYINENS